MHGMKLKSVFIPNVVEGVFNEIFFFNKIRVWLFYFVFACDFDEFSNSSDWEL